MRQEYIIMDASVKYMNARNPLEEGLFYTGTDWTRKLEGAYKYDTSTNAIDKANNLQKEAPVRVFMIQTNGNQIGFAEIKF